MAMPRVRRQLLARSGRRERVFRLSIRRTDRIDERTQKASSRAIYPRRSDR